MLKADQGSTWRARIRIRFTMAALKEQRAELLNAPAAGEIESSSACAWADGSLESQDTGSECSEDTTGVATVFDFDGAAGEYRCIADAKSAAYEKVRYTKRNAGAAGYTILAPQMAPIHLSWWRSRSRARDITRCCCLRLTGCC